MEFFSIHPSESTTGVWAKYQLFLWYDLWKSAGMLDFGYFTF